MDDARQRLVGGDLKTGVPVVIATDPCVVDFATMFNEAALIAVGPIRRFGFSSSPSSDGSL
ncbi:hypothetical protein H310_07322 [Aphanomyces invadans]|uniref:Uncharacterized protein n=1 Tax=Aphanomyces invadans TaxID=157072 RepID=A0A024U3H5_9STRA|nr:hypothetical protein H310_07322 [Aphanomyces invadans]ETW00785.1 hypothetical protein H310_07322 [Aphanomyces invadans]|eukprot:XP_008870920.1 hypothetical protein H310_07322 [Aphanomyces invadans]